MKTYPFFSLSPFWLLSAGSFYAGITSLALEIELLFARANPPITGLRRLPDDRHTGERFDRLRLGRSRFARTRRDP